MRTAIREGPTGERREKGLCRGREEMAKRRTCDYLTSDQYITQKIILGVEKVMYIWKMERRALGGKLKMLVREGVTWNGFIRN